MSHSKGFEPIGDIIPDVLKKISQCAELRLRLEAELGRPVKDDEFRVQAERAGCWL